MMLEMACADVDIDKLSGQHVPGASDPDQPNWPMFQTIDSKTLATRNSRAARPAGSVLVDKQWAARNDSVFSAEVSARFAN